jgi:hypothetical protein
VFRITVLPVVANAVLKSPVVRYTTTATVEDPKILQVIVFTIDLDFVSSIV